MTTVNPTAPVSHPDRFFIGGAWVAPSSDATIDVIDAGTEEVYFSVPEAQADDMSRAVAAARTAFDEGPWPGLTHAERAGYLRALGAAVQERGDALADVWPRESGTIHLVAQYSAMMAASAFESYAALADTFPFEELAQPSMGGGFGLLVREPVGVVGAIIPWNAPLQLISHKIGPALLAGCSIVLKLSPEAPGEGYLVAEAAEQIGLPPGVFNVVTADREVSELLVRDPGSTRSPSPVPRPPAERSRRCAVSGSPAARSSSAASRPRSSSTTPTSRRSPPRSPVRSAS